MKIKIENVYPSFFEQDSITQNSIWNNIIEIKNPEKISIISKSGKGKTTFVKIITGISQKYKGNVLYNDKNILHLSQDEWANIRQTKITTVFQNLQLFDDLTAEENLIIKNKLTNYCTEKELKKWLSMIGLDNKAKQKCSTLSLGQQQRVAILRAICQPFKWIIMDEPFSHIDEENILKCWNLILKQINKNNAGLIITSLKNRNNQFNFTENTYFDNQFIL